MIIKIKETKNNGNKRKNTHDYNDYLISSYGGNGLL